MLLAGAAAGQIFECVDAKGSREFAQFCPPGTVKETRLRDSGAGASKPATSPAPAAGQKPPAERQEAEAKAEKEKAQSKEAVKGGAGASKPATSPAPGPKSLAEREAEFRKRMLERKEAEAKAEKAEKEKTEASAEAERNCYDARSRFRELQEGYPIPRIDPNTGARTFLENKNRPAETANAQKAVDNWCNKK
jgi:hypothetical protein